MTVTPKRGRAVLWPSVYDEDPNRKDPRTVHTALKVIKGVKYGGKANILDHTFCAVAFDAI
jgi:prolyl 4-hydroxylase